MKQATITTKLKRSPKSDTAKTPKATPGDTPINRAALIDEATLLRAAKLLPALDRIAIVTAGKLMDMAKTETPGRVVRVLAKELRDTPALRDDAAALGLILRGVAEAFDGAGKGAE